MINFGSRMYTGWFGVNAHHVKSWCKQRWKGESIVITNRASRETRASSSEGPELEVDFDAFLLLEIATEASERFEHRQDRDRLVRSTLGVAREMISQRPTVTDFIGEIAIATSRAEGTRLFAISTN